MFSAPSISKREKFKTRSSRAKGMNAMSSPCARQMPPVFFRVPIFPLMESAITIRCCCGRLDGTPFLPRISNGGAVERLPVLDRHQKRPSLLPSVFFFRQNSDVRDEKKSAVAKSLIGFFFAGSQPRAVRKKVRVRSRHPLVCEDARKNRMPNNLLSICFRSAIGCCSIPIREIFS